MRICGEIRTSSSPFREKQLDPVLRSAYEVIPTKLSLRVDLTLQNRGAKCFTIDESVILVSCEIGLNGLYM
jgi:hypothetical protein